MSANALLLADEDKAFYHVDTHTPAHMLPPGVAAAAINKRFEDGKAWPRLNVNRQRWGVPYPNLADGLTMTGFDDQHVSGTITGLVIGNRYYYEKGTASEEFLTDYEGNNRMDDSGYFTAVTTSYVLWATSESSVTADALVYVSANPLGFGRFNDPNGVDTCVLLTDEWRSGTARTVSITDTDATAETITAPSHGLTTGDAFTASGITGFSGTKYAYVLDLNTLKAYDTVANALLGGATGRFNVTVSDETGTLTVPAEDGGRGRAWRIVPGNVPYRIPMNGHDIWDPSTRMVPCYNGLVMLRGASNERHYFQASAVDTGSDNIQLNCAQAWADGDLVLFVPDETQSSSILGVNANTLYYVKKISGNKVELYTDSALSSLLNLGTAFGRFYLERRATQPGYYGNGAPNLIMQPSAIGQTAFENGFKAVPTAVQIIDTDATNDILTAENHRLLPGEGFTITGTIGGLTAGTTYYANIINDHQIKAYDTLAHALAGGATGLQNLTTDDQTGTLTKVSASAVPMPPAREGIYYKQRLVLVNGRNNIAISDPLNPLHYTPYTSSFTANLGESDEVRALLPLGTDSLLFLKENSVLALGNFSQGSSAWVLEEVTREYGLTAPLTALQVGKDDWGLSRRGVVSAIQTEQGELQGVAEPVSRPMKLYMDAVDWKYATKACAGYWNNRYFLAHPRKGQTVTANAGARNNGVMVFNFLNKGWEGLWQGDALEVFAFARLNVFGEEKLCFVNYAAEVCFFDEGWTDLGEAIEDELTTRIYTAGSTRRKVWLNADVTLETNNAQLSVTAQAPGYNETQELLTDATYDPTQYLTYGQTDYDPETSTADQFDAPHRADYAVSAGELLVGKLDVHQNITEGLRMRVDDWGVQFVISNTRGSARIQSVFAQAMPRGGAASRNV